MKATRKSSIAQRSVVWRVAGKELREAWRDGRARWTLVMLMGLVLLASVLGWRQHVQYEAERRAAAAADRAVWESQGPQNPHSAAHTGQYAFKPISPLSAFDRGQEDYLGVAVWLEAHYQDPAAFRPAEDQPLLARLGGVSGAYLLQALAPLLLIFLGHGAICGERERQTLPLTLATGVRGSALACGKLLALAVVVAVLLVPVAALLLPASDADTLVRGAALLFSYGLYLLTVSTLVIGVSSIASNTRTALIVLLCGWALCVLAVPRVGASLAEALVPSADPAAFWRAAQRDIDLGADGHDPSDARTDALRRETIERYGVETIEDLPINFSGLALQAGEEYGNEVFDRHYGEVQAVEARQQQVLHAVALLSPLVPLQTLSAGYAGTDPIHHWRFAHAAEQERRIQQRFLNEDLIAHPVAEGETYAADPELWRRTSQFSYRPPPLAEVAGRYAVDLALCLAWALSAGIFLLWAARRLDSAGGSG